MPKNESRNLGKLKNEFNMMVTAAVKQEDGTSPSVHSSFLYTFKPVRDITLRDLYGLLSGNNNLNKKISFDIENKTLIAIRISALNLDNEKYSQQATRLRLPTTRDRSCCDSVGDHFADNERKVIAQMMA